MTIQRHDEEYLDRSELVIGIVCAVGVNYDRCLHVLEARLNELGYSTRKTSVSTLMENLATAGKVDKSDFDSSSELKRIRARMRVGNALREKFGRSILGLAAVQEINRFRLSEAGDNALTPRVAHILTSFKRPEEISILRGTYGAGFYLVGLHDTEDGRAEYLVENKGMNEADAKQLMADDQEDGEDCGQKTRDTYYLADVFVSLEEKQYRKQIERFIDLLMSHPYHTPTPDEYAMFMAFSASLRSSQLGRQVGASIVSRLGDVVGLGCNDVPKPGGGQYWCTDGSDQRDHILGYDSNDKQKEKILVDLLDRIEYPKDKRSQALAAFDASLLADITEFGRAMHAEMDALLSCARSGISVSGTTLYSTTFPCHNCARHILGAGVLRVVFIEPYVKSAAPDLHRDGITTDTFGNAKNKESTGQIGFRIPFESFVGIGPRRYSDLFVIRPSYGKQIKRKKDGDVIDWPAVGCRPRLPMHPISYLQREQFYSAELTELTSKEAGRNVQQKRTKVRSLSSPPAAKRKASR